MSRPPANGPVDRLRPRGAAAARSLAASALLSLAGAGCAGAAAGDAPRPTPPGPAADARLHGGDRDRGAGAACGSGRRPLNVRDFGAGAGGDRSDAPAINRALRAALETGNRCVYVPPGVYVVRQDPGQELLDVPIRPEVDGLTLFGAPDGSSRIVLEADAMALLVSKGDRGPPEAVNDLTLRDLTFEVPGGSGRSNAGVVQLNHCPGLRASGISIRMNGRAQHARGIKMDGLATSQGTTGRLERVLVDGASKTGLYIAAGTHHLTVDRCETRGSWSAPPVNAAPPGIGVADAHHIAIIDHDAHHNRGDGLLIVTSGAPPVRMPGLPDEAYGSYHLLAQAHGPATGVRVLGGRFWSNGEGGGGGIRIASAYPEVPRDVVISGVSVRGNAGPGILVEAGEAIEIRRAVVGDNGAHGILVRDVVLVGQDPGISRTSGVRIVHPNIQGNGRRVRVDVGGLEVRGRAAGVELVGGIVEAGDPSSRQRIGVALVEEGGRACVGFSATSAPRISGPIPFGGSAGGGRFAALLVPEGPRYDCVPPAPHAGAH